MATIASWQTVSYPSVASSFLPFPPRLLVEGGTTRQRSRCGGLSGGCGRHDDQVVGGHVAAATLRRLHQAPVGVAALVVRLQDAHGFARAHGELAGAAGREVVAHKHLPRGGEVRSEVRVGLIGCQEVMEENVIKNIYFIQCDSLTY